MIFPVMQENESACVYIVREGAKWEGTKVISHFKILNLSQLDKFPNLRLKIIIPIAAMWDKTRIFTYI